MVRVRDGHSSSGAPNRVSTVAAGIADVARGLREELGDVSVYFAGLSISGATALHLARDYGDLFAGVVVVASAATNAVSASPAARAVRRNLQKRRNDRRRHHRHHRREQCPPPQN